MKKVKKVISNVRVGKPEVRVDLPSHVAGVHEGNEKRPLHHESGVHLEEDRATATASRSTGINASARDSVVPGAPRLTPP